jgi:hypothetical protein
MERARERTAGDGRGAMHPPFPERLGELAAAADRIGLRLDELFVACFARGSNFDRPDLEAMILGLAVPSADDYDLVALTINEMAAERSSDVRVRYADEV